MHIGLQSQVSPQAIIEQPENVYIGDHVQIKPGVVLRPENGFIYIGNHVVINHYTVIHAKGGVEIGDWCIIAPHCGLYAQNHSYGAFDRPITLQANTGKGITLMGDNWLGGGAIIVDGVTLGKGTVVGAGSVVTKSFPMAKIIAGNPAKILKDRSPRETWNFHNEERCSVDNTPEEFWPYINQRAQFGASRLNPEDTVLDLGCGEGYITNLLQPRCRRITGIDYSAEAVHQARQRFGLECLHMACTDLRFASESFDKVLCFELLEHLTILQAKKTVAEMHRVLKKGGVVLGSTPQRTTPQSAPSTYSHIYEYSQPELRKLFQGFAAVEIAGEFFSAQKAR